VTQKSVLLIDYFVLSYGTAYQMFSIIILDTTCFWDSFIPFYFLQCGNAPLHIAADEGQTEVCKILLAAGVEVNKQDEVCHATWSKSLLYCILNSVPTPSFYKLIYFLQSRLTPLHVAALFGRTEMCKILLEAGADLNMQDSVRYATWRKRRGTALDGSSNTYHY
jgi:Ankyrin repeats (many copies)/Ankyrin repeat